MADQPVYFEPVSEDEAEIEDLEPDELENPTPSTRTDTSEGQPLEAREAEEDPYPLAGPILEGASSRELRGRCSGCDSRLRVRLEDARSSVRVRCPVCSRTRRISL